MKCLQEHISDIRDYLDEPSSDTSDWDDDAILVNHLNNILTKQVGVKIANQAEDYFGVEFVIPLVTNQFSYVIPSGQIRSVEIVTNNVTDSGNGVYSVAYNAARTKIDRIEFYEKDFLQYSANPSAIAGQSGYFQYGSALRFGEGTRQVTTGYYARVWLIRSLVELHYGTMVSATSTTLVINSATKGKLPLISNAYLNYGVRIYSGTGINQERQITGHSYDPSTGYHTLTMDSAWGTTPASSAVYSITPPIPPEFEDCLSMGAALRAKVKVEDPMSELFQMYQTSLSDALSLIKPRNREGVRRIRRVS